VTQNYNFNGLFGSILPNVYIDKITLEGADASVKKASANKQSAIELHIKPRKKDDKFGWTGNPTADKYIDSNILRITYNLFLEVSDINKAFTGVFKGITQPGGLFEHINLSVVTFSGIKGRKAYLAALNKQTVGLKDGGSEVSSIDKVIADFVAKNYSGLLYQQGLEYGKDYTYTGESVWSSIPGNPSTLLNTAQIDPSNYSAFLEHTKDQYRYHMPNGTIVYKIPIRIVQELYGEVYPDHLSAIATCTLDTEYMQHAAWDKIPTEVKTLEMAIGVSNLFGAMIKHGRHATEVIIDAGKTVQKGMMFYISENQGDTTKFNHMKGDLWFGGVHKDTLPDGTMKYMAGNNHDNNLHPILEYILVDNKRILDFRQITTIKKTILNFQKTSDSIFGGSYYNLQSKVSVADFSEIACFSNLISSIQRGTSENPNVSIKLFFTIDWGKLIKRYSLIPGLLDLESSIIETFGSLHDSMLSFKIYRERLNVAHNIVNQNNRKLIYDGYPKIFYYGRGGATKLFLDAGDEKIYNKPISALVPVNLNYGKGGLPVAANLQHYTFTDYDVTAAASEPGESIQNGQFKYSIEVEFHDPTLDFLMLHYNTIEEAIQPLEEYVAAANGSHHTLNSGKPVNFFNAYTGKYSKAWQNEMAGHYSANEQNYKKAFQSAWELINIMRFLSPTSGISGEVEDWPATIQTFLSPDSATPEGIIVAFDMLNTIFKQLEKLINSFSTRNIPKVEATTQENDDGTTSPVMQHFTKDPLGSALPKRKIKVIYDFDSPEEIVDTTNRDAGYDYFGNIVNRSENSIGLKVISKFDYDYKSDQEFAKYFYTNIATGKLPFLLDSNKQKYMIEVYPGANKGRYFTVPKGYTFLPNYFVDPNTENVYWQVINNIIRYKSNLPGNSKDDAMLGYGPNDTIPGFFAITKQMERILKDYQTLASQGAYFSHSTIVDPMVDPEVVDEKPPVPDGAPDGEKKPKNDAQTVSEMKIPWAKNYGQEKLLLSLICANAFNLDVLDASLGTFNCGTKGSRIQHLINIIATKYVILNGPQSAVKQIITPYIKNLPLQILALMYNHSLNEQHLKESFRYNITGGDPLLYDEGIGNAGPTGAGFIGDTDDDTMYLDKFGQFWFSHQNLGEIEYLSGYQQTTKIPPIEMKAYINPETALPHKAAFGSVYPSSNKETSNIEKYEYDYNSYVNSPVWKPLTVGQLNNFKIDAALIVGGHVLCRIKKYKNSTFNSIPYDVLSLPLYDEYFFIAQEELNINQNANFMSTPNPDVIMNDPKPVPAAVGEPPQQGEKDKEYCEENPDDPDCIAQQEAAGFFDCPDGFVPDGFGGCVEEQSGI